MPWPKGKSRKKPPPEKSGWKARAGNNWSEKTNEFLDKAHGRGVDEWRERSFDNRFELSEEATDFLRSNQLDVQWLTKSVYGQEQTARLSKFLQNGWTIVEPDTIPGVTAVEIEGSVLAVRPMAISEKARQVEKATAKAVWDMQQQYFVEGVPVSGGSHPTAIRSNRLNRTYERIEVPKE
jgi:hypothetical protein